MCRTVPLLYAVLDGETSAEFQWAFEAFLKMNGNRAPNVCFTDRDIAAEAAISMAWPACEHLCCIWHLWGNIKKNIAGKLGSQYQQVIDCFFKASRAVTITEFEQHWAALMAAAQKSHAAMQYLDTTYAIRKRWAFCYRLHVATYGVCSTQRAEGQFAAIKRMLRRSRTLQHLADCCEQLEDARATLASTSSMYNVQRHELARVGAPGHTTVLAVMHNAVANNYRVLTDAAATHLSNYALAAIHAEAQATAFYTVTHVRGDRVKEMQIDILKAASSQQQNLQASASDMHAAHEASASINSESQSVLQAGTSECVHSCMSRVITMHMCVMHTSTSVKIHKQHA